MNRSTLVAIVLSLIFILLLVMVPACRMLAPIQIENKTSKVITVYIDEYQIGDVKPNDKIQNNLVTAGHDWYLIEAYDTQRNVVYSHKFSEQEIKETNWKIVIQER